jgi:tyrosyl-tRNA synthetase
MPLDQATLDKITRRAVAEIVPEGEFIQRLQEGRPLRLKMGFDPSRPDLTLGHVVGLRKLRQLQELGHKVILIVGDWTAQIGDPSGRSTQRTMLSADEVKQNAQTYMRQFFRFVDREKTEVVWQSEWFGKFTLEDVIRLTAKFTVGQFLQREDFRKRFDAGNPIAITELLYPLLQAYDSVAIKSDVEFGGTDQKFNLLVGRDLQEKMGQRPQQCFMVPILVGTDGVTKMSKSMGNFIAVEEPPETQYGKVMSLPDTAILNYYELVTDVPEAELVEMQRAIAYGEVNPMTVKKRLAFEVVKLLNGSEHTARQAADTFERVVQRKEAPEEIPTYKLPSGPAPRLSKLLVDTGLAPSVSEARRLINQKAVEVAGAIATADEPPAGLKDGDVIRVGKRRWVRVER